MRQIEKIKGMSISEMADWMAEIYATGYEHCQIQNNLPAQNEEDFRQRKERMSGKFAVSLAYDKDIGLGKEPETDGETMNIMLDSEAKKPTRAFPTDAGLDLYSAEEKVIYPAGYSVLDYQKRCSHWIGFGETFDTGVHIELKPGQFGWVTGRSGLNMKEGIICPGGTIDQNYRGSIKVKLYNLGEHPYIVKKGDRIAQLIIQNCEHPELLVVDKLEETDRNNGGFGSTGK